MTHAELEQYFSWFDLKSLPRSGWVQNSIQNPESVASHSWGMSILALKLCPTGLDLSKVLQLCIVHDLPEAVVGDITPHDGISKEEKQNLERKAINDLEIEFVELWEEYEMQSSEEAKFVKRLDKLDMAIQSSIYKNDQGLENSSFLKSALKNLDQEDLDLLNIISTN